MFRCHVVFPPVRSTNSTACQRLELRANGGRDRAAPLNCHLVSGQLPNARRSRDGFSDLGPERGRRGRIGGMIYSATRTSCLPSLRPSNSRRSVAGAFSRLCCTSTLCLSFPPAPSRQRADRLGRARHIVEHEEALHPSALDDQVNALLTSSVQITARRNIGTYSRRGWRADGGRALSC
jgi:hypothetical protein